MGNTTPLKLATSLVEIEVLGSGLKSPLIEDPATGDFVRVEGVDNVKDCIIGLIETRIGERVMNEDFGTLATEMLFEDQQSVIDVLPLRIIEAINIFEPRVAKVTARAQPFENGGTQGVVIQVTWTLLSTGMADSLTYPYYLESEGGGL
jgi:phage baseplate assembly protein W